MSQAEIKMFKKKVNIKNEHNDTPEIKITYNIQFAKIPL